MINVAIVEDEKPAAELIGSYLQEFGRQEEEEFSVRVFGDAVSFLENYKPDFDLVFMDIMMPSIDGMRAAKKLRERDRNVQIIFVTSMSQFAVKGYEVAALDFIVKPVSYFDFCIKMRRAVFAVRSCDGRSVVVPAEGGRIAYLCARPAIHRSLGAQLPLSHRPASGRGGAQYHSRFIGAAAAISLHALQQLLPRQSDLDRVCGRLHRARGGG